MSPVRFCSLPTKIPARKVDCKRNRTTATHSSTREIACNQLDFKYDEFGLAANLGCVDVPSLTVNLISKMHVLGIVCSFNVGLRDEHTPIFLFEAAAMFG
jgi:hypothetical protein